MQIGGVAAETESLENTLEKEDVAGDAENALLLVTVLLGGFIKEIEEDGVVKEVGADDEALHLIANVDREVALGDRGGEGGERTAELGGRAARAGGGSGVGSEEAVLRGVGDSGEAADELLHSWNWEEMEGETERERGREVGVLVCGGRAGGDGKRGDL